MTVVERYSGLQSTLKVVGSEGCHFLVLCSIAEESSNKVLDLVEAIRVSQSKGWVAHDFLVRDAISLLNWMTGRKWTRKEVAKLETVRDNDYTEVVYYNPRTKLRHFRRRGFDTLDSSKTVSEGHIEKYYIYTVE